MKFNRFAIPVFLLWLISFGSAAQSLKVMTYNLRFDNPADSVNAWPNRKQKVFDLLSKYDPDVIGVQEALLHQLTDITGNLGAYRFIGVGRDDGKQKGEYAAILYKSTEFDIADQGTFWLSEHPKIPGSKDWDAAITRVATWAIMVDKKTSARFFVLNTHFDHIGKEARRQSALIIKDKVSKLAGKLAVIITGDFNSTREEDPYKEMVSGKVISVTDPVGNPRGTFCTFKVKGPDCRAIDYIFISQQWQSENYSVITDNDGIHYPSDHLPVMATLTLRK
jgi:endonuclease/exonuclease/phosphatase family metal-dependent hydrolase